MKSHLKFYILTDLEGPAGVSTWAQTREPSNVNKLSAMDLLTHEVNARHRNRHDEDRRRYWVGAASEPCRVATADSQRRAPCRETKTEEPSSTFDSALRSGDRSPAGADPKPYLERGGRRSGKRKVVFHTDSLLSLPI